MKDSLRCELLELRDEIKADLPGMHITVKPIAKAMVKLIRYLTAKEEAK